MFRYKVKFWDEINQEPATEIGFVGNKEYYTAAKEVTKYYGEDNISEMRLEALEEILTDSDIMELVKSGE